MNTRRYILLALLIAVAIFDYVRMHKRHEAQPQAAPVSVATPTPSVSATPAAAGAQPAWLAYDRAASLRDASATEFQPSLDSFNSAKATVPHTPGTYDAQDLDTCNMWLAQYRKGGSMKSMAANHVNSCTSLHRDVAQ